MSTITKEFTKEQLIDQAKTRMEANRYLLTRLSPESATVKEVAMNLAIDEIALASLEAEPVASCIVEDGGMCIDGFGEYVGHSLPDGPHQLYADPPAPVVPKELRELLGTLFNSDGRRGADFDLFDYLKARDDIVSLLQRNE